MRLEWLQRMIEPLPFANRSAVGEPSRAPEARGRNSSMRVMRAAAAAALLCAGLAACSSAGAAGGSGSDSGAGSGSGQVAATSSDVSFGVDGTKTYGTLEIPAHRSGQHLAAALLLAGSGATDRDGNTPSQNVTPQTLKLVAGVLAQQGIMTLRFDKYFTGQPGAATFVSDPGNIDLNAYIRQADAAYAFLRGQPTADRQHLLVVGHSEGGFYAMLVADTVSPHPAGLALLEPQDQRILSLVAVQLDEQLNAAVQQGQLSAPAAQQQGDRPVPGRPAGGHVRPAAADRAAAHPGAAYPGEREGRAHRRRGQPGRGRG